MIPSEDPASGHVDSFAADNLPPRALWPAMPVTRPEFAYPARLNCVADLLDRWIAEGRGDRPCLIGPAEMWTYADLQACVNRIGNVLVNRLGLKTGNRVLLRSANTLTMAAVYLAVLKAGGIVVATMPLLRAKEIAYPLNKARIALALCDGALAEEMEGARALAPGLGRIVYWDREGPGSLDAMAAAESAEFPAADTAAGDVCLIAFTSGTTGEPKGTMHVHRDMLTICDGVAAQIVKGVPEDRFIGSPPFAFTFGLAMLLFPLRIGAAAILPASTAPDDLARAIGRYRATVCFTAPTAYRQMLARRSEYDLSSLRRCISSGEALDQGCYEGWLAATGLKLMNVLGGTEMLHVYLGAADDDIRPGSLGKALLGYAAKVVDDDGRDLPSNTPGRLAVRGPLGCRYLADPRQESYVQNGWNLPGDRVLCDDEGYFWYQARTDDMIVSAGYNIAGPEVEAALLTHPDVVECGVVAAPDALRGSAVKAYVLLRPGVTPAPALAKALQDHVKREIAPYKYPRLIEFVTALPKTPSGKLQRFALRAMAAGSQAAGDAPPV